MGTTERGGSFGGSLTDGMKRRVCAPESSPERPAPTLAEAARGPVSEARSEPTPVGALLPAALPELAERAFRDEFGGDDRPAPMRRMYHPPRPREPSSPAMLGFRFFEGWGWRADPQRPFKPRGLYIVGSLATGDRLAQAYVGQDSRTLCSCEGVPAHFFATARSYEQIAKAVADGQELPGWGDWGIAHPGVYIIVQVTRRDGSLLGPADIDLGMWGHVAL